MRTWESLAGHLLPHTAPEVQRWLRAEGGEKVESREMWRTWHLSLHSGQVTDTWHSHLDVVQGTAQLPQPGLAVQVAGDQEEVDGGVGVMSGHTLQAAQLQRAEHTVPGLRQPDAVLIRGLLWHDNVNSQTHNNW